jgi:hypothetical protein
MSGWLTGFFGLSQPGPVIHNQPPPPSERNPFYYDTTQSLNPYDPYKEEDEKEEDYEEYEENLKDYSLQKMTTNQEISIGNYQIMNPAPLLKQYSVSGPTQYLNTGSKPIIFTRYSGLSFNLDKPETVKQCFIKMPDGKYYAFEFSYDYHSKHDSHIMDLEDNESKAAANVELDKISYGAFTESAVQSKVDTQAPLKYLVVNVYKTDEYGRVISKYNYKELQLQDGTIEDARDGDPSIPGVNVHISEQFINTLLQKEPNASVQEPVPEFYEEKVDRRIEATRKARQTYSEATRSGLELQAKLRAYHAFYDTLFITTKPNPATDERKIDNMSYIELKNYIEKLHHIVVNSQLDYKRKDDIKAYLKSLHKSPNITKIVGLKLKLTSLLRDTKLIDLMGIKNEVPIIDKLYFNDKVWMNHYNAGMAAAALMNKEQLGLTFTKLIEPEIQNIKYIIDDRTGVSPEKLSSINESLQKIKGAFLPKLMDLLKAIQSLVKNHPFTRRHVIIDLDNLTELEQALDRLTQLLASSKLSKKQELTALTHADDPEGGSRAKNKKKTRKRTKTRNKKRNKSKRHKGYSRR